MKRQRDTKKKTNSEAQKFGRKTFILAIISFVISFLFSLFNGAMAAVSRSVWYASMAIYYFILSGTRLSVVLYGSIISRKYSGAELAKRQLRVYKSCGVWTILMELALTAAIIHIIFSARQKYGTVMAIVIAAYSFYKIVVAIRNLLRARGYNDYCVQALRNLAVVDAAVSMISLTATLTATFGDPQENRLLIIMTAATIGALIIALGIFMVVRGTKLSRRLKQG